MPLGGNGRADKNCGTGAEAKWGIPDRCNRGPDKFRRTRVLLTTGCGFPEVSNPPATLWDCGIWIRRPEPDYRLLFKGADMVKREHWLRIPTELSLQRFQEFVLPHLSVGSRGPDTKLSPHALFNYI